MLSDQAASKVASSSTTGGAGRSGSSQGATRASLKNLKTLHALEKEILNQQQQAAETQRQTARVMRVIKKTEDQVNASYQAQASAAQELEQHQETLHDSKYCLASIEVRRMSLLSTSHPHVWRYAPSERFWQLVDQSVMHSR